MSVPLTRRSPREPLAQMWKLTALRVDEGESEGPVLMHNDYRLEFALAKCRKADPQAPPLLLGDLRRVLLYVAELEQQVVALGGTLTP